MADVETEVMKSVLTWVGGIIASVVGALIMLKIKRFTDEQDEIKRRVRVLEQTTLSEEKVKDLLDEKLDPIHEQQGEMTQTLKAISTQLDDVKTFKAILEDREKRQD